MTALLALGSSLSFSSVASAATILGTDFTGTTATGTTLSGITWTSEGITAPATSMTVTNTVTHTGDGDLWTTADAVGFFAPNNNIGSGGEWSTEITFTTQGASIALNNFALDWINLNNSGINQPSERDNEFSLTILDADNGDAQLFTDTIVTPAVNTTAAAAGVQTTNYDLSAVSLDANTNYTLLIEAAGGTIAGSHAGIDAVTLTSNVVPEPSSTLLFGLGGSLLLFRRVKK